MCRIIIFFALTCGFAAHHLFSEPGEGRKVLKIQKDNNALAAFAVKEKNYSIAIWAYGKYFEDGADLASKLAADTVIKFSKRKGLYHKATSIPSFYEVGKLIPNILSYQDGELAAQILATKGFHNILYQNGITRAGLDENGNVRANKKRRNKKGAKVSQIKGEPTEVNLEIPEQLFESKSLKARYLAILAAAYTMQKKYSEKIAAVDPKTGEIAAAKILFKVMTGAAIDDKEVKAAYGKCLRINKPVKGPFTELSEVNMNVPGMATLCEALGRTKNSSYIGYVHNALTSKDERVKIDAVRAVRRIADPSSVYELIRMVERSEWSTLIEVCLALGEMPDKRAIEPLIRRFKKETGRFRLDVNYALSSIAGKRHGYTAQEWVSWWTKNKAAFKVDAAKSKAFRASTRLQDVGVPPNGAFYSISIFSDRCCFVVDYSLSMKGDKIADLKENMTDTVENLTDNVEFNIVEFGGDVNIMYDRALTNNKRKGAQYIYDAKLTLGTRSMDAMERGVMIPEVDTIYFLSDGAPIFGQMQNWGGIHQIVRLMNRYRHIAYSTICFKAGASNAGSMAEIADQNYGHTEEIQ